MSVVPKKKPEPVGEKVGSGSKQAGKAGGTKPGNWMKATNRNEVFLRGHELPWPYILVDPIHVAGAVSKVIDHVILNLFQDPNALHVRPRSRYSPGRGDWSIEYFDFFGQSPRMYQFYAVQNRS
jgi:hypothetical protein